MGLGFVLLIWAILGTVIATAGAVLCGSVTAHATRRCSPVRRRAVVAAAIFPFLCLGWAGGAFVFQAIVNEALLGRDLGLGDAWHCPLTSGYELVMIDVTDQGTVYNPRTQHSESAVADQPDTVFGVRQLQVAGKYILGGGDSKSFEHWDDDSNNVDFYFLLDTQTGAKTQFQSYEALRSEAGTLNIEPNLQPIYAVYSKYRFSWFDVFAGMLFLSFPVVGAIVLVRWIVRLRRTSLASPQTG